MEMTPFQLTQPAFMEDRRARRLASALIACITASDARPWGFLPWPGKRSPVLTAMRTLASLRLAERYSNGWRVTEVGRLVAAEWKPGSVA
jgi:hypothetical protein